MAARDTAGSGSDDGDVEVGVGHVNKLANLFTIGGRMNAVNERNAWWPTPWPPPVSNRPSRSSAADAKTAAAAAAQLGCEVGAIANSLVFECDGEPLLVMASGAARVDTDVLARNVGAAADRQGESAAGAQRDRTGHRRRRAHRPPEHGCARSSTNRWQQYDVVWTAAGTPDSVMPLTYEQLLALTGGVEVARALITATAGSAPRTCSGGGRSLPNSYCIAVSRLK